MRGSDNVLEYQVILTWDTKGPPLKAANGPSVWLTLRQVRENVRRLNKCFFLIICILFTTPYNQNIHNEGQRHIIVHTDLTTEMWTDFESFLQQILFNKWHK